MDISFSLGSSLFISVYLYFSVCHLSSGGSLPGFETELLSYSFVIWESGSLCYKK